MCFNNITYDIACDIAYNIACDIAYDNMVDHFAALGTAGGAIVFFKCNIVYDITCDVQF